MIKIIPFPYDFMPNLSYDNILKEYELKIIYYNYKLFAQKVIDIYKVLEEQFYFANIELEIVHNNYNDPFIARFSIKYDYDFSPIFYGNCQYCGKNTIILPYYNNSSYNFEWYCDNCYPVCNHCRYGIDPYNEFYVFNDEFYCREHIPRCYNCNTILSDDNWVYSEYYDDFLCPDCANYCPNCDNYYTSEDFCHECGYCLECCDCSNEDIRSYDYKPKEYHFYRLKRENPFYMGIELEVEANSDRYNIIECMRDLIDKENLYYFKHDGSLDSLKGIEIVFHPCTIRFLTKIVNIREVLKELRKIATSWNNGRCGIHIHIERDKFSDIEKRKMILFSSKCRDFIKRFSGRTSEQIMDWCKFYSIDEYKKIDFDCIGDRYKVINFTNRNTIEFRIFRGTLNEKRFIAFLRFVKVFCEYIKLVGIGYLANNISTKIWKDFCNFVKKNYPQLFEFFKEKGLVL